MRGSRTTSDQHGKIVDEGYLLHIGWNNYSVEGPIGPFTITGGASARTQGTDRTAGALGQDHIGVLRCMRGYFERTRSRGSPWLKVAETDMWMGDRAQEQAQDVALDAQGVRKSYKGGVQALQGVDLCVESGMVVCLAGPNGAGKTTLVRICATQLLPTAGEIQLFGTDIVRHPQKARSMIAVVPQEAHPDLDRSAWHHAVYYARARGVRRDEARRRAEEALRTLGMWEKKDTVSRELSGGLRQRVLIAMVMVTQAPLLFLDEPTTGLDPVARREMWQGLGQLRERSTVLLTTHYDGGGRGSGRPRSHPGRGAGTRRRIPAQACRHPAVRQ